MKNLFLLVVLLLTASFTYASNDAKTVSSFDNATVELTNSMELESVNFIDLTLSPKISIDTIQIDNTILSDCSGNTVQLGNGDSFVWSGSYSGLMRLINAYLAQ